MSLKLAEMVIGAPELGITLLYIFAYFRKVQIVPGTYLYYRASTWATGLCLVALAGSVIEGGVNVSVGDYWGSIVSGTFSVAFVILLIQGFNDDNWFNKTWKRLKQMVSNLRKRLTLRLPRPVPSPT